MDEDIMLITIIISISTLVLTLQVHKVRSLPMLTRMSAEVAKLTTSLIIGRMTTIMMAMMRRIFWQRLLRKIYLKL